jgi:Family of unknown function (DUF6526)
MTQNYANHVHRPTMTIVGYLFLLIALAAFVLRWLEIGGRSTFAIGLAAVVMSLATLLAISRVYITKLQDRIIRIEMRMRAAALLSPDQLRMLERLTIKQMAALRFASDEEMPALVERATREHLKPDDIKRAVRVWVPDLDRT